VCWGAHTPTPTRIHTHARVRTYTVTWSGAYGTRRSGKCLTVAILECRPDRLALSKCTAVSTDLQRPCRVVW
jgi:hypothetical protein